MVTPGKLEIQTLAPICCLGGIQTVKCLPACKRQKLNASCPVIVLGVT